MRQRKRGVEGTMWTIYTLDTLPISGIWNFGIRGFPNQTFPNQTFPNQTFPNFLDLVAYTSYRHAFLLTYDNRYDTWVEHGLKVLLELIRISLIQAKKEHPSQSNHAPISYINILERPRKRIPQTPKNPLLSDPSCIL